MWSAVCRTVRGRGAVPVGPRGVEAPRTPPPLPPRGPAPGAGDPSPEAAGGHGTRGRHSPRGRCRSPRHGPSWPRVPHGAVPRAVGRGRPAPDSSGARHRSLRAGQLQGPRGPGPSLQRRFGSRFTGRGVRVSASPCALPGRCSAVLPRARCPRGVRVTLAFAALCPRQLLPWLCWLFHVLPARSVWLVTCWNA